MATITEGALREEYEIAAPLVAEGALHEIYLVKDTSAEGTLREEYTTTPLTFENALREEYTVSDRSITIRQHPISGDLVEMPLMIMFSNGDLLDPVNLLPWPS